MEFIKKGHSRLDVVYSVNGRVYDKTMVKKLFGHHFNIFSNNYCFYSVINFLNQ